MRRAKAYGGSHREVFDEGMHARAVNRLKLEAELREAIDQGQFQLCYQPIVSLSTGHITGFEALVRWQHPEHGLISPKNFLEVAEQMGVTIPIGKWVIQEACRQAHTWQAMHPPVGSLSMTVNLSAKQFTNPSLIQEIQGALQVTGIEPRTLQLEIGENIVTTNPKHAWVSGSG